MAPKLLNILLQRNDSNVQWGFRLSGGKDLAKPLTIVKVFPGTLSAQYLVPGDIVLNIQGYEAKSLLHVEAVELVRDPGKSLELVIQKTDTPLSSNEDLPASIWGPEPVLQRPSEWLRRSPSPFMNQCFQPISPKPSVYQRSVSVGSGYTEPSGSTRPMSPVLLRPSDWLRQSPTNHPTVFSEPTSPTEPIIQAPSAWMKRAPSPSPAVFSEHKPTGYRNANSLRQHFEAVNQDAMQQESNLRTGYTPMSLDNKIRQRFESLEVEPGFQKLKSDVTVTEENFRPLFNPPSKKWRAPSEPYQKPFEAQKIYDDSNVSYFSETKTYQDGKLHTKISNDVHKPQENVNIYSRLSPTPIQEIIGPNRHQIQGRPIAIGTLGILCNVQFILIRGELVYCLYNLDLFLCLRKINVIII
ncbi:hypothetical protein C0J52_08643 [Blattella germanica]|nr:hypothetical protein C0J52_08643 [Blattella germanica]